MGMPTDEEITALAKKYASEIRKAAASCKASKHTKARRGRRPIRVDTLLKKGSQSGSDLRLPVMGGTKFPTADSLQYSKKLLKKHMKAAEMGGPSQSIKSTIPNYSSKLDVMPKTGADMSKDPLIQYLQKQAAEERTAGKDWPKGDRKIEKTELIDSSSMSIPKGETAQAKADEDPTPHNPGFPGKDWRGYMSKMFDNKAKKDKACEKDYPASTGQVDKVLRS